MINTINIKDKKLVSIIVPVYNTALYLPRCIESVLKQQYSNFELLLIDDGSTDNSLEVCFGFSEKDDRIRVFHKENGGVSSARNKGIEEMSGDFFMFVDSDDALSENILIKVMEEFDRNDLIDLVVFGWKKIFFDGTTDSYIPLWNEITNMQEAIKNLLINYNGYGGGYPNKIWRTEVFQHCIQQYDTSLFYFEDIEWMTRMFTTIRKFVTIPEEGYLYYIRDSSVTFSVENAERKEYGYHQSVLKIIEDLTMFPELKVWFSEKYYPEIVNGVINAWQNKYTQLCKWLFKIMKNRKKNIFSSSTIPLYIKIRCLILLIIFRVLGK